jgi:hypothetical protein
MSGSYRLDRFQTGDVLAVGQGFEPQLTDSESVVLPLYDPTKRPRSLSRERVLLSEWRAAGRISGKFPRQRRRDAGSLLRTLSFQRSALSAEPVLGYPTQAAESDSLSDHFVLQ